MAPKETKQKPSKKSHSNSKPKISKPLKPQQRKPPSTTSQTPKPQPPLSTTSPSGLPLNWPSHIPYLSHLSFSPLLTPSHYSALRTRPPPDSTEPLEELPPDYVPGPCTKAVILPITDKRHPACGQAGLFAARDLKPGEFVVRYLGEIHPGEQEWGGGLPKEDEGDGEDGGEGEDSKRAEEKDGKERDDEEGEEVKQDGDQIQNAQQNEETTPKAEEKLYNYKKSDYDLWLDHSPSADLAIDAARAGNEARFVNDYRGVPNPAFPPGYKPQNKKEELFMKRPNAEFKVVWDPVRQEKAMAVYVLPVGKKAVGRAREVGIERGREVLVSYGKGFWGKRREEEERKQEEGEGVNKEER